MAFVESSTKAGWLSLKALRKQDGFRWKLYESRLAFVESSTKAGWLSLKGPQKQDCFHWKLYKSKMAFVESSTKTGWPSLKALWKQDGSQISRMLYPMFFNLWCNDLTIIFSFIFRHCNISCDSQSCSTSVPLVFGSPPWARRTIFTKPNRGKTHTNISTILTKV